MNSIPKHITLLQYYEYKYEYKPSMLKLVFILLSVSQGILKYTIVKYISVKFIKSKLQVFFQNISIKEVYLLCTFINCFFVRETSEAQAVSILYTYMWVMSTIEHAMVISTLSLYYLLFF